MTPTLTSLFHTQMGYGKMEQTGEGIHLRQFSRAFVIEDSTSRIAFVSIDSAMMGDHIRSDVSSNNLFYYVHNIRTQCAL